MVVILLLNFLHTGLASELAGNRVLTMVKKRVRKAHVRDHPTI